MNFSHDLRMMKGPELLVPLDAAFQPLLHSFTIAKSLLTLP
jgi:hypothetical protein